MQRLKFWIQSIKYGSDCEEFLGYYVIVFCGIVNKV